MWAEYLAGALRHTELGRRPAVGSRNREPVTVCTRRDTNMPCKRATQVFLAGESATPCDVLDAVGALLESTPCRIDANAFHRSRWTAFARLSITAGEIAGTHACALCKTLDAKIGGQMIRDPAFQLREC